MLDPTKTVCVIVDVQEKLTAVMHGREALVDGLVRLVRCMRALGVPVIQVEQLPEKMGPTIPELQAVLDPDQAPISKSCFSCYGSEAFRARLDPLHHRQVLLAGIETHVCVYQTAVDMMRNSFAVEVVVDATSSRQELNKQVALEKIRTAGAGLTGTGEGHLTTVETAVFEMMRGAKHPAFRDILRILK